MNQTNNEPEESRDGGSPSIRHACRDTRSSSLTYLFSPLTTGNWPPTNVHTQTEWLLQAY